MLEAIQMQYDTDINIFHSGILQYACFQSAKQGKIEVGIFQGGIPGSKVKPKAEIAIFDTSWKELERKESTVYQEAEFKKTKLWFSLHRLERQPGIYWFGVRTRTTNGAKWIERGLMDLRGFSKKNLDLSKAVLGSLPQDDSETYSRNYIAFVPRLSLKFKRDEIISVYLEIYNLGQNQTGSRGYMLEVNVTLVEDDTKKESYYAGGTVKTRNLDPEKSSTSIHHEFERTPVNYSGPVAEFFTIDTSQLRLGSYRMIIKINDNSNSSSSQTSCIFELGG